VEPGAVKLEAAETPPHLLPDAQLPPIAGVTWGEEGNGLQPGPAFRQPGGKFKAGETVSTAFWGAQHHRHSENNIPVHCFVHSSVSIWG